VIKTSSRFSPSSKQKTEQHDLGMMAYYAKWMSKFSNKVKLLATAECFPKLVKRSATVKTNS